MADRSAFTEQAMGYMPQLFSAAVRMTRNRADAEDLVQEAALHACRGQAGFSAGTNFKAWFYRILTTCFWGKHRRDRRRPSTVDAEQARFARSVFRGERARQINAGHLLANCCFEPSPEQGRGDC